MDDTGARAPLGATPGPRWPWLAKYPPDVTWDVVYEPKPLGGLLDEAAARHGLAACTNFFGKRLSYAEIARLSARAACGLRRLGVTKGVKVGLLLPNTPTFIIYYFAILKIGGVVVNFNPLYTAEELAFQARDSQTSLIVTADLVSLFGKAEALLLSGAVDRAVVCSFPDLLPVAKSAIFRVFKSKELANPASSAAAGRIVLERDVLDNDGAFEPAAIDPEADIAVLQYTGGTTGTPKGAMLSHANLNANVRQAVDWAPHLREGEERLLAILPFFHVFAMTTVMNFGIAKAAELFVVPRFSLDDALKLIDRAKITAMAGVPTLFGAIVRHPNLARYDLSSIKYCLSGGAPLPLEIKREFEALAHCKIVEGYGLSEASPVVTCGPHAGPSKDGSIGLPLPATIVSLRDLADPAREAPAGERGELCVKGPQVMRGYWNRPEETAQQFVGGFLRTGDVAVMDEDGFLYIVDRIKDLIICSGYNVYPRRVEDAIYAHAAVQEATVIGVPDAYRGEAPKAFIRLKAGAFCTSEEMMEHLKLKLSKIEMPAEIEFRDSLPKTLVGKLSKKELKQEEVRRRAPAR